MTVSDLNEITVSALYPCTILCKFVQSNWHTRHTSCFVEYILHKLKHPPHSAFGFYLISLIFQS